MTQQQTPPTMAALFDSNDIIRALITQADAKQPLALQVLRECITSVKERLLKAKQSGRNPGMNFFSNERIEWSWQRRQNGALEQCLFLATLAYAHIATNAPSNDVPLSQSGLLISGDVLHDLMRIVATDKRVQFAAPFPYSQDEMKRAFEEHMLHMAQSKRK